MSSQKLQQVKNLYAEAWKNQELWEKNLDEGIEILEKLLNEKPGNTQVITSLGALISDRGRHREALAVLKKAEGKTSDANLYFNIGVAMMNISAQTRENARAYFLKAGKMEADPLTIQAYIDFMGY